MSSTNLNNEISNGAKPRRKISEATQVIFQNLPDALGGSNSRELNLAKTKFEEFQMWYERAIHVYLKN